MTLDRYRANCIGTRTQRVLLVALCLIQCSACSDQSLPKPPLGPSAQKAPAASSKQQSESVGEPRSSIRFEAIDDALPQSVFRDGSESLAFSLPETTGGGVSLVDYDRDGRLDVIAAGGGRPDSDRQQMPGYPGYLFRQIQPSTFQPARELSCLDFSATYHSASVAADYDSDGFVDLLITGFDRVQWFRNQGDGTFESIRPIDDRLWSTAAAFFDADQDSDLDLYVVHYANWSWANNPWCPSQTDASRRDYCGPTDFLGLADSLYENQSDGTFVQRTPESFSGLALRGLGILAADLDGDRDTDLYVTNDVEPNLLFRNDGGFQFTELGRRAGVATNDQGRAEGSMGVAIGDYNNDQKFDLWVTNYADEFNALYRGAGRLSFSYASSAARITATDEQSVGWGTALGDLELDGDEDIVVINGHLERFSPNRSQRPHLLENIDAKRFVPSGNESLFFKTPQEGRGLAVGDLNRDGLLDLVVSRVNAPCVLVENRSERQGAFLSVRLVGRSSNRDAVGAVVSLSVKDKTWIRQRFGGGSYASTSDQAIHFGVPSSVLTSQGQSPSNRPIATLRVDWPSGQTSQIELEELNSELLIIEPSSNAPDSPPGTSTLFHFPIEQP